MANSLRQDVTNRHVVMQGVGPALERVVLITAGFGSVPFTMGSAIFVTMITGDKGRMSGFDIERVATKEEAEEFGRRVEQAVSAAAPASNPEQ